MAQKEKTTTNTPARSTPEGERIAKVLSRRGVASRREAERLVEAGEVTVNGKTITSPALNVTPSDRITISGHPLPAEEPARVWLYYKPEGLVTSASDEKGRDTVFDHLPEDMPRVMTVGRLDLNSEGLLLLTNDGELKRRLELPSTGWLRKYRVRIRGYVMDPIFDPLRKGITIDGEHFAPMQVMLDRQQGANAWLTVGLREGRNREIRRAMEAIGLSVNRLIRISYGPFRLGDLEPGDVEEVKARVLRDQLGESGIEEMAEETSAKPRLTRAPRKGDARLTSTRPSFGTKPDFGNKPSGFNAPAAPSRGPAGAANPSSRFSPPKSGAKPGYSRDDRREGGRDDRNPRNSYDERPAYGAKPTGRTPYQGKPTVQGEGTRSLSRSWQEATTPREGAEGEKRPGRNSYLIRDSAASERSARPSRSSDKPAGKSWNDRPERSERPYGAKPYGAGNASAGGSAGGSAGKPEGKFGSKFGGKSAPKSAGTRFGDKSGNRSFDHDPTKAAPRPRPGGPRSGGPSNAGGGGFKRGPRDRG